MLKLIRNLLALNGMLTDKVRAVRIYDEALAHYSAREYGAAFPLLREAAELGNIMAKSLVGSAYLFGHGCPENGREAERWLRMAVDEGYAEAVGVLGMAYATGKAGCRRDLNLALPLLQKAAASGDAQSVKMLEMIEQGVGIFAQSKRARQPAARH